MEGDANRQNAGQVFQPGQPQQGVPAATPPQAAPVPAPEPNANSVTWTASEYIAHQKSASWYFILAVGACAFAIVVYLLTEDVISTGMIAFAAIIFGAFGAKKPRVLTYQLDNRGVTIGDKHYAYGTFKSFGVVEEGPLKSVMLMPLKRFMPAISVYYDPDDEEKIVSTLADYLPHEEHKHDAVDRFLHKVKF